MPNNEALGFAGLGIMGCPMAENLIKTGYAVTVYNRTRKKTQELVQRAALARPRLSVAESPSQLARNARVIFLCLGDTRSVEDFTELLLEGIEPGSLVVDISTISPSVSRELAARYRAKGAEFLDAPCTGSKVGAINGTLTFMVGGPREAFERARPYLQAMGKAIFHAGAQGMGLQLKLTQNLIGALTYQAMSEGFVLARKAGLFPSLVNEVLQASAARSPMIDAKLPLVLNRQFDPHFSLKWMYKDLGLMLESGREMKVPLPTTALVHELFGAAVAQGHGEEDFSSAITVLEKLAGVEVVESRQA